MDVYFAVFNVTRPERVAARKAFIAKYGLEQYNKVIAPYWKKGIMSIFHNDPTPMTKFFVNAVAERVCKRLGETFEPVQSNRHGGD